MRSASDLLRRWWGEIPIHLYAALCGAVVLALWAAHGIAYDHEQTVTSYTIFYICALIMFAIDLIWSLLRHRPARPLGFLRERYVSREVALRVLAGLPAIALCIVMIPIFSSVKSMVPLLASYDWDATFIAWDRALFFGRDAWVVLQPLLGHPPITAALALAYHLWALLLYPGCIFFAVYAAVDPAIRRRFFLSYAMCWSLIGGAMAVGFASVGPVFAEALVGIDDFAPQMAYLNAANAQIPVMTVPVQDMLLARFSAGDGSFGSGISAMPSMHVAIAALFWLALREVSPRAGRLFFGFFVVIGIGSVHLAYHYAVDGLVSLAAVWAIWRGSEYVFAAWDRLPFPAFHPALRTNTVPAE